MKQDASSLIWYYVDDRDIAVQGGLSVPKRAKGTHPDLPTWGTGEFDWRGFDPETHTFKRLRVSRNPFAVNPKRGYVVGWNVKLARGWQAGDKVFNWAAPTRATLLEKPLRRLLRKKRRLELVDLVKIVQLAATRDLRAAEVYPWMRRVIGKPEAELRPVVAALDRWVAEGAHRRDLDKDNVYEHSDAIATFDAWWEPLARAMFEPVLGKELVEKTAALNPFTHMPAFGNASGAGGSRTCTRTCVPSSVAQQIVEFSDHRPR